MRVLVTGGAGYIGSHTVAALVDAGHEAVVVDNLSRGHRGAVHKSVPFYEMNIEDPKMVQLLQDEKIEGVLHFAAHSQVGESMVNPAIYYENNVVGSYHLIESIRKAAVPHVVFSSTAAVYGEPEVVPITEHSPLHPTNVYGRTKLMIETMLKDYSSVYPMSYMALRYFNAAGASPDGFIGEDHEPETHLIPLILQAALGKRESITIFGDDYDTEDGTCIRDYIHVLDLADAHVKALEYLKAGGPSAALNLGTGSGFSVRNIVDSAKKVTGIDFKVEMGARRLGDPSTLVASVDKAAEVLGWKATHSAIDTIIADAWRWHQSHPNGFTE